MPRRPTLATAAPVRVMMNDRFRYRPTRSWSGPAAG
jgi:hypothetical protein